MVNFTLPKTPKETIDLLNKADKSDNFEVYVGCAKWNKQDLKGFMFFANEILAKEQSRMQAFQNMGREKILYE